MSALEMMERIGRAGVLLSVCCGPTARGFRWSVQVLTTDGDEFDRPFSAESFEQAIAIAVYELCTRGWLPRGLAEHQDRASC